MAEISTTLTTESRKKHWFIELLVRLVKEKPLGSFGGIITLLFLGTAVFADFLAPYSMNEVDVAPPLAPPSIHNLMGSDQLGRDMLSRIIYGARVSVITGLTATLLSIIISAAIGILCGYFGGKFDLIVQRFVDGWISFPGLILLIVAITIVDPGMWQIIVVLGFLYGIGGSRIVRGAVLGTKQSMYIEASKAIGCSNLRILMRHILPNIMAPIIILSTTRVPTMILTEASLSFLGLGIPPPAPTWGGMLSMEGRRFMLQSPWLALWPGLALAIVVYGVNMLGDALRDLLDPRLRGGIGRYVIKVRKAKI